MAEPALLLKRLDAIGASLANLDRAKALIGLGSVGLELNRLDSWSDLDFFVIVEAGEKQRFLENLDWLEKVHPVVYAFRNTSDGYKLLFGDGIFCEFAVFEPQELQEIPYNPGRVIWRRAPEDEQFARPASASLPLAASPLDWLVGEALTNLFVGLQRFMRGEKLSATRFIQQYAVDRVIDLAQYLDNPDPYPADPYSRERRFEQRFPTTAARMPEFIQGYDRNRESAAAILEFLQSNFNLNPQLAAEINRLAHAADGADAS